MLEFVEKYTTNAEYALASAVEMSSGIQRHINARAYYSQQAAENVMMAATAASGVRPKWTHNLVELAERVPSGLTSASTSELDTLSGYYTTGRYGKDTITKSEADQALHVATAIVNEMRGRL